MLAREGMAASVYTHLDDWTSFVAHRVCNEKRIPAINAEGERAGLARLGSPSGARARKTGEGCGFAICGFMVGYSRFQDGIRGVRKRPENGMRGESSY
jgi:hypothetical protein